MDSLRIEDGVKRICINDDETRVITFDPADVTFVEKFYALIREFQTKQRTYQARAEAIDAASTLDTDGIPNNMAERLDFMRELCTFMRGQIDALFGEGTAKIAFGDALNLQMFSSFFAGIMPFITQARQAKVAPYTNTATRKRVMK